MNRPDALESELIALEEAGFSDVDCYFKNGIFTFFWGKSNQVQIVNERFKCGGL